MLTHYIAAYKCCFTLQGIRVLMVPILEGPFLGVYTLG